MANWKEGDKVRIVTRDVTDEDRRLNRYFAHMAGMTGTIQSLFSEDQIAVRIDPSSAPKITAKQHKESSQRMRDKFLERLSEQDRKLLTKEELEFNTNFMQLVRSADLEKL